MHEKPKKYPWATRDSYSGWKTAAPYFHLIIAVKNSIGLWTEVSGNSMVRRGLLCESYMRTPDKHKWNVTLWTEHCTAANNDSVLSESLERLWQVYAMGGHSTAILPSPLPLYPHSPQFISGQNSPLVQRIRHRIIIDGSIWRQKGRPWGLRIQRLEKIDLGNDWKETNGELCWVFTRRVKHWFCVDECPLYNLLPMTSAKKSWRGMLGWLQKDWRRELRVQRRVTLRLESRIPSRLKTKYFNGWIETKKVKSIC